MWGVKMTVFYTNNSPKCHESFTLIQVWHCRLCHLLNKDMPTKERNELKLQNQGVMFCH